MAGLPGRKWLLALLVAGLGAAPGAHAQGGAIGAAISGFNMVSGAATPVFRPGAYQQLGGDWVAARVCVRGGDVLLVRRPEEDNREKALGPESVKRVVVGRDTMQVLTRFTYRVKKQDYYCSAGFVQRVVGQQGYSLYRRQHFDRSGLTEPTTVFLLQRTPDGPLETVPEQQKAFQAFMLPILADNAALAEQLQRGQIFHSQTPYVLWKYLAGKQAAR
ncbi:hypothetical protein [Hymenobacter sp. B81]|uniref:hypothetical protein n=1 Tax=Hymenobacter sp. B81 TaxID=3344878 RepID=UPI0037DDDE04